MGFGRYSFLICFFILLVSPVLANECSKEDKEYADFWQNYYTPEDAYAFGLKVQSLVSNEDLSGIFSLVQGELQNGPRKEFVASKIFKEVFDEEWISQVLGDNAPCSPIGWRGFMLGNGLIWYNKTDDVWTIFSINGAALLHHLDGIAAARGWPVTRWITQDNNYRARGLYDSLSTRTGWITYEMTAATTGRQS